MVEVIKLYVDDVRSCPQGWTVARTIDEAKASLELGHVAEMSIDHDMGACADCIRDNQEAAATLSCEHMETGHDLVQWMIANDKWPMSKPTVHSQNPTGAARMREAINMAWPLHEWRVRTRQFINSLRHAANVFRETYTANTDSFDLSMEWDIQMISMLNEAAERIEIAEDRIDALLEATSES